MTNYHDPRLLYTLNNVHAYHIQAGHESSLTPSGPQTMNLLMVSTPSSHNAYKGNPNEGDFYLHLQLPPELDLPLPATTQVYPRPPRSYLIPRLDLGPDSGAFTRIELPEKVRQEEVETFETILAQCTAFMERAPPPTGDQYHKSYNPTDYAAGGRLGGGKTGPGQIVLVDEDDGSVVGELGEGAQIHEDPMLSHGSKNPVEIEISEDGNHVHVRPVSEEYLQMARHPAYASSSIVQNAAAASRLIVTTSSRLGNLMTTQAEKYVQSSESTRQPVTFSPTTRQGVRKIHGLTQSGVNISNKTVGSMSKYTQNIAATLARRGERKDKHYDATGKPNEEYKPGLFNKSLIAFTTVMDGLAEGGTRLVTDSGSAATLAVNHKYGAEAGEMAAQLAGGAKNVGLVYIDVTGVTRKAIIKSVAKGMVVGKVKGGGQVIVGGGDGGAVPEAALQDAAMQGQFGNAAAQKAGAYSAGASQYGSASNPSSAGGSYPTGAYTGRSGGASGAGTGAGAGGPPAYDGSGAYMSGATGDSKKKYM